MPLRPPVASPIPAAHLQLPVAVNVAPVKVLTSVFPHAQGDVVCDLSLSCHLVLDEFLLLAMLCARLWDALTRACLHLHLLFG